MSGYINEHDLRSGLLVSTQETPKISAKGDVKELKQDWFFSESGQELLIQKNK